MKRLLLFLIIPSVAFASGAITNVPPPSGMYYSTDGTGNPGTWAPVSGGGAGAISWVPPAAAMYCSSDGSGNPGTWVPCNPSGGGGGSLPTATFAGQIITSTAAGTTYTVQNQVYYSRSTDTIASIETQCASLCTYVVTIPQTFTLAANHTLSSNVQLEFAAGGKWTVNGAFTLTIPGPVTGTLNPHFAGSSTLSLGPLNGLVPVEWFGAVGDWNGTTGTDNTTAIQACFNAMQAGQCQLQASLYKITAALTLSSKSRVGLTGTAPGGNYTPSTAPSPSGLVTTSASADMIDVTGSSGVTWSFNNVFTNFSMQRSVAPTGTATGISSSITWGEIVDNVQVQDSIRGFYCHQCLASGTGHFTNDTASWGFGLVTGYSATQITGFYLDSSDGNTEASWRGRHLLASSNLSTAVNTIGIGLFGNAINDVMVYGMETANVNIGIEVDNTGGGGQFSSGDIHFYGSILDSDTTNAILVTGATAATNGGVEFNGGYIIAPSAGAGSQVDIESSAGVSVTNMEMGPFSSSVTNAVLVNGGSGNNISHNRIKGVKVNGINLATSTTLNVVEGNNITGSTATGGLITTNNATYNVVGPNALAGTAAVGFNPDAGSNFNTGADLNTYATTLTLARATAGSNPLFLTQAAGIPAMIVQQPGAASYSQIGFAGSALTPIWQTGVGNPSETGLGVPNKYYFYNVGATKIAAAFDNAATPAFEVGYSGALPSTFSKLFNVGTTGQFTVDTSGNTVAPSVKTTVYTVATLPSASTLGAGAQVTVSDATTFTPGTCTGGGSDYMIAVSNGTTWSCH